MTVVTIGKIQDAEQWISSAKRVFFRANLAAPEILSLTPDEAMRIGANGHGLAGPISVVIPLIPSGASDEQRQELTTLADHLADIFDCPVHHVSTIVIDLDDTILEGAGKVYVDNEKMVLNTLAGYGFNKALAETIRGTLMRQLIDIMGISKDLQRTVNLLTYHLLCGVEGLSPQNDHERELSDTLVEQIYAAKLRPFAGAKDALENWLIAGYRLILATRGDVPSQLEKIKNTGLTRFFSGESIYIWPKKTSQRFLEIAHDLNVHPSQICVIGDGMRSDVNPAIEAGMTAIHVQTSDFKEDAGEPIGEYWTAETIAQAPDTLQMIQRGYADEIRRAA